MKITNRSFLIPESPEELALLKGSKHLKEIRLQYKDREYSCWTEEDDDKMLASEFLAKIDSKFYFETILLNEDLSPDRLAHYIVRVAPEVLIDVRKQPTVGYNLDPVKVQCEINGIHFRWIPMLGTKGHLKDGLLEASQLLKKYRRLCFVGKSDRRLKRICKLLREANKII